MGDELTQSVSPAAMLRAKFLKAALKRGAPPTLLHTPPTQAAVERKWSDESPELVRAHLQQLLENAPEAIAILDANLRVVRINSEFSRMFGYTAEEALGRTIQSLLVPADQQHQSLGMADTLRQ